MVVPSLRLCVRQTGVGNPWAGFLRGLRPIRCSGVEGDEPQPSLDDCLDTVKHQAEDRKLDERLTGLSR